MRRDFFGRDFLIELWRCFTCFGHMTRLGSGRDCWKHSRRR